MNVWQLFNCLSLSLSLTLCDVLFIILKGLHGGGKMSTLARSNASLYGTKEDLYDRLKRHAYTGKKGKY